MTTQPEQRYCEDTDDHPAHDGGLMRQTGPSELTFFPVRCPGRWTPSRHGGIHGDPQPTADPFGGLDDEDQH